MPREVIKNRVFLRFFANIFLLVCHMIMIFLLTQKARLGGPFRYLEHIRKVHKKVSRGFSKKVFAQKNEVLSEYSNMILSFILTHFLN